MKRHPSLQDLSRDHHHALVQAQRLRKSAQDEEDARLPEEVAREFLQFWEQDAAPHFREEEEVLLPVYARHVRPSQDGDVRQLLDDHAWFRDALFELKRRLNEGEGLRALLGEAGQRLDDHIRLEERRVFERMQEVMTEEDLDDVGKRSQAFRERWRAPGSIRPYTGGD